MAYSVCHAPSIFNRIRNCFLFKHKLHTNKLSQVIQFRANSVDPDKMAHSEPSHFDIHRSSGSEMFAISNIFSIFGVCPWFLR